MGVSLVPAKKYFKEIPVILPPPPLRSTSPPLMSRAALGKSSPESAADFEAAPDCKWRCHCGPSKCANHRPKPNAYDAPTHFFCVGFRGRKRRRFLGKKCGFIGVFKDFTGAGRPLARGEGFHRCYNRAATVREPVREPRNTRNTRNSRTTKTQRHKVFDRMGRMIRRR